MNIQFKNSDGGLTESLQDRVEQKLGKLSRFTDTNQHSATASFEITRAVGSQQSGDIWRASVTIDANGSRFYASELAETPSRASEKVIKEVRSELRRAHKKERAVMKREGTFWKTFELFRQS